MKYRSMDITVISIARDWELTGARIRSRSHSLQIIAQAVVPGDAAMTCDTLAENLQKLAADIRKTRNSVLFLTGHLPSSVFFELNIPKMSSREIRDCLLLELDSKMPQVPLDVCLNWHAAPTEENSLHIRACACDAEELTMLGKAFAMLHWKIDGFIPALLALPADATALFKEFGSGFARQKNSWVRINSQDKTQLSAETTDFLQKITSRPIPRDDAFEYGSCIAAASAIVAQQPKGTMTDYSIFNGSLRPRRLRGHIIYMLLMLALIAVSGIIALWGNLAEKAGEYRKLSGKIESLEQEITRTKRKIKSSEKDDKDFQKILESVHGEDKLLQRMTRISAVIPGDVLLSDLKINENTWDINCLTESTEIDLAGTFRRIPGFKLKNIEQRPTRQEMTSITVRLEVVDRSNGK